MSDEYYQWMDKWLAEESARIKAAGRSVFATRQLPLQHWQIAAYYGLEESEDDESDSGDDPSPSLATRSDRSPELKSTPLRRSLSEGNRYPTRNRRAPERYEPEIPSSWMRSRTKRTQRSRKSQRYLQLGKDIRDTELKLDAVTLIIRTADDSIHNSGRAYQKHKRTVQRSISEQDGGGIRKH